MVSRDDILAEEDGKLFFKLKHSLYLYVNEKVKAFTGCNSYEDVHMIPSEELQVVQNYIFIEEKSVIKEFCTKNPYSFTEEELDIILGRSIRINR